MSVPRRRSAINPSTTVVWVELVTSIGGAHWHIRSPRTDAATTRPGMEGAPTLCGNTIARPVTALSYRLRNSEVPLCPACEARHEG